MQKVQSFSVLQASGVEESPPQKSKPISTFVPAIAKSTGKPCMLCTQKQAYCRYHNFVKPAGTCSSSNKAESPIPETEEQTHPHYDPRDQTSSYSYNTYPAERPPNTTSTTRTIPSNFEPPIAQSTGRPCKLCTASQKYCRHHSDYKTRNSIIPKLDCSARVGINISSSGKAGISSSVKAGLTSRNRSLSSFQVPIAQSTGRPCKLCTKSQAYCHHHVHKFLRL